jgi:diadenosine tetraphosphate (Ap4A) HIT family hydrolase
MESAKYNIINLDRIFGNHRQESVSDCIFCSPPEDRLFLSNDLAYALWDAFPVTRMHSLIIPRRHAQDYFSLTAEELLACDELLRDASERLRLDDSSIEGFNIGANIGIVAGQTIWCASRNSNVCR